MTNEEKARAYDEALERAKKYNIDDAYACQGTVVKLIFPQLAESEDERIRKYLIEELKATKSVGELKFIIPQPTREECIAYLEKQKGQKPSLCDECKKKSTCLDTKYGDDRVVEQCINFVKMKQKPAEWSDYKDKVNVPYCSSEPEWSEEDEKQIRQIERIVKDAGGSVKLQEKIHNWFKSLRPSWKPSEEQMEYLAKGIIILGEEGNYKTSGVLNELHNDLKKLL